MGHGRVKRAGGAAGDVAVIGMACRFPGAEGYDAFWDLLAARGCAVREIPPERWDWRAFWGDPEAERNRCNSRWGGFIDHVDAFDAPFFSLSAREAELLDPQQRIMLELAWRCFEDAGLRPSALSGAPVGVYVGSAILDYKELVEREGLFEAQYATGVAHSVISSRISHWFNLSGPSMPLDAACASSLYALHLAVKALQRGECTQALAGGINVLLTPHRYISFAKMGILSPTGTCRSFDDAADGTVRGEGAGLVLLKPLAQALADGDPIHGVVKGSALNHSGKTRTLSYPNPDAQAAALRAAWADARVEPETISYLEAHGTGTPKGDPLEFEGLRRAFAGVSKPGPGRAEARCGVGTVKPNIGHLESAAGIAGVIKVLVSMQRGQLPPLQNFERLNHRIDLAGTPFHLVDRLEAWTRPTGAGGAPVPLRAGVSSFGFAGTNAHVVLEEAPARSLARRAAAVGGEALICLSARTPEALGRTCEALRAWIERRPGVDVRELGAALLATRERFAHRIALIAEGPAELARALGEAAGGATPVGAVRGTVRDAAAPELDARAREIVASLGQAGRAAAREPLAGLAELHARGAEIDGDALPGGPARRDLRLPGYPFARERHWLPSRGAPRPEAGAIPWLHPLVHENASDLGAQRFRSGFDGAEPFLAHHRIRGIATLPAAALVEMARAACALSAPGREIARLEDVVFARAFTVGDAARRAEVTVSPATGGGLSFEISSAGPGGDAPAVTCRGLASLRGDGAPGAERLDLEKVRARCAGDAMDGPAAYDLLERLGFEYGASHRGLSSVQAGGGELLARVASPAGAVDPGVLVPPGLLDAALQGALLVVARARSADGGGGAGAIPVPYAIGAVEILGRLEGPLWVSVRAAPREDPDAAWCFDLDVCDDGGAVQVRVRRLEVRWLEAPAAAAAEVASGALLAVPAWEALDGPAPQVGAAAARLVLLCEPAAGLAEAVAARLGGARVVTVGAGAGGVAERFVAAAAATLEELRTLLQGGARGGALVQLAFADAGDGALLRGLGGLLRSAALENPAVVGQAVSLARLDDPALVATALDACAGWPRVRELRWRDGRPYAARWRPCAGDGEAPLPWKDGGVYLITGGVGGLGMLLAEDIARSVRGPTLYLAGRSEPTPGRAARIGALRAAGATVVHVRADVARREAVDALIAGIRADAGRLDGVIHAGGVLRDGFVLAKTEADLREVLAAKVHGAVNLDEATRELPLDLFVAFSSIAGVLGNAGQADYAAANAFLDAFCAQRAERVAAGLRRGRSLSVDWPLWREGGMRVPAAMERELRDRIGMRAVEAGAALAALRRALAQGAPQVLFVEGDVERFQRVLDEADRVAPAADRAAGAGPAGAIPLGRALDLLRREVSAALKVDPARMDLDAPMESHGIDSIVVVELTRRLERTVGPLPRTLFFEHRTLRALAQHLAEAHAPRLSAAPGPEAPALPPRSEAPPRPAQRFLPPAPAPEEPRGPGAAAPIAIVGLAGRYPGARTPAEFWRNLRAGTDCITEIPSERWDHARYYDPVRGRPGKTSSRWGGFIDGVDEFDPLFFNISPREAEGMDPQERLFLQCAYEAIQDAGYTRQTLGRAGGEAGTRVGVFVGVMWEEYPLHAAQEQARGHDVTVTGSPASIANRVSYFCDFTGPSLAVDTLCSSSLTALHLACESLHRGECAVAIAGGVNVSIHPNKYLALAAGGYVSSKGRCESFGEGGDGYVPGEGVGAVVLKPLARALAEGDHVYGVIRGTAVNHGGKTNGFTVPSPAAQAEVIGAALARAGVDARAMSYVEAHGTGTSLGDPIEIAGLARAFSKVGAGGAFTCAIGSAKSNIGHCESAAGIAGLTKVLLQLAHRELVPSLHAQRLNPHIDFDATPFRVQRELAPWARPVVGEGPARRELPRVAGLSSFGAGGSNAHVVVEELEALPAAPPQDGAPALLVLSARDEARLRVAAGELAAWLRERAPSAAELADVAYTLQIGREAMEERLAVVASSPADGVAKLDAFLAGDPASDVLRGRAAAGGRTVSSLAADDDMAQVVASWIDKRKYDRLLGLWVDGFRLDWARLHRGRTPRRVSLPTYPFARERYWLPRREAGAAHAARGRAVLHPLLHENTSDLGGQRYSSTFTGEEPFLRDHVVQGRRVLPAAAQLELACAAARAATGGSRPGTALRLETLRWSIPVVAGETPVSVDVELAEADEGKISFELRSGEEGAVLHARGTAAIDDATPPPPTDLASLRGRCAGRELGAAACYAAFAAAGIAYGPAHQALRRILVGRDEALAELALPESVAREGHGFALHPSLVDGALQAAVGLLATGGPGGDALAVPTLVPAAGRAVEVLGSTTALMWAHVRRRDAGSMPEGAVGFDLDLLDDAGRPCVRFAELVLVPPRLDAPALGPARAPAEGDRMEAALLVPAWDAVTPPPAPSGAPAPGRTLLVGAGELLGELEARHPGAHVLAPGADEGPALAGRVAALGPLDAVVWCAPESQARAGAAILAAQEAGTLHLFRVLRALLAAGHGERPLDVTLATRGAVQVGRDAAIEPAHAGVHGLAAAVAQEHSRWRVRLLDLDPGADAGAAADALARAPADPAGLAWAVRGGEWFRQRLVPFAPTEGGPTPYEDGAAYVVVGGAGGVGEVWTEHVLRAHAAQVIWIGRRPLDRAIRDRIARLAALGPAPRYVQADASDPESLRAAYREIKRTFPRIRGVVHSAIVLRDQTLARMDEAAFRAAYAAKVDVAVQLAEVFADEPLAFALFFSSTQALRGSPGQCNYAAACAFEDAFALHLGRVLPCPVKVMDWGWWGEVGVVAGEVYRARMARAGIGSIQAAEGMAALDALLRSPLPRAAFIKTTRRARLEGTAADEALALAPPAPAVVAGVDLGAVARAARPVADREPAEVAEEEGLLAPLLAVQLERAGVAWRAGGPVPAPAGAPPHLRSWLAESVRLLAERRPEPDRVGEAWARWDAYRASRPERRARVELAETVLRAVPDLLAGRRPATEVMFPGGGFGLVDGVYRGNPVADAFNAATAEAVAACVEARLRDDPGARLRILEVGAGTGGTTAAVLARLDPLAAHLEEYCYSDLSRGFLGRVDQARAGGRVPVVGRVFDVDAAPAAQGLAPGSYDVVVAANVLHATAGVRRSLRNVKATLRRNGVLVLNELCQASLFGHVTFGLLEGWWRPQDAALRIPGCPALSPEGWRRALEGEGFGDVRFPVEEAHVAGQQIVVAASDGVIRQPARDDASAGSRSAAVVAPAAVAGSGAILATRAAAERRAPAPGGGSAPGVEELRARALAHVRRVVGGLLKVAPERLDPAEPLGRYGIDSLLVMQITSALQGAFGPLGSTLLFEQQTLSALVEELLRTRRDAVARLPAMAGEEAGGGGTTGRAAAHGGAGAVLSAEHRVGESARRRRRGRHPGSAADQGDPRVDARIAVVGLAGRYPEARDVRSFWRNLRDGRHCVTEIPPDRWDWRAFHAEERGAFGTIYTRWGGFIDDVARFDAAFFRVSPREAAQMDPQERQFLETAYASIEDAGYTPGSLSPTRRVGVFAGVMNSNYGTGAAHWSVANRVSFALDLRGPSLAVDTACSSSLTAIHLAVESLRTGACDCAIAGGVNLILDPLHLMKLSAAAMLSPGDRCRTFGEGADGIVDAEGVGAVVLKPLARALADGDHVYGVIRGGMLNAGGRTHGYTVPNPVAQEEVIAEALRRAGVSPRDVSYVEAHGTGTELGDPIEIAGLTRAFGRGTTARQFCAIGSVKSNIGHAESAAGVAALTKVLLQLEHRQLVPSLHADAPNPRLELAASPFTVQRALSAWRRPVVEADGASRELPRVAGISSFGAGGANAHLVVEEPPAEAAAEPDAGRRPVAVVLSARTERDLRERARQLALAIDDGELTDARLADAGFTLQVGREALPERLGLVAASVEELRRGLASFVEGEVPAGGLRGRAEARDDGAGAAPDDDVLQGAMATWTARGQLEKVLKLWVAGLGVDWRRLYDGRRRPRRVSLPTYPFAGERHWIPIRRSGAGGDAGAQPAATPPTATPPTAAPRPAPTAPRAEPSLPASPPPQPPRSQVRLEPAAAGIPLPPRRAAPGPSAPAAPPRVTLRPIADGATAVGRAPEARAAAASEIVATPPPARAAVSAAALRAELAEGLARALYMQAGEVDPDRNFVDMGLDSVVGVEWIRSVNKQYGTALKVTVVYDHPTVRAFATFLEAELARAPGGASRPEAPAPVQGAPRPASSLRELLRQVQEGELSVEDADRRFQALQDLGAQANDG